MDSLTGSSPFYIIHRIDFVIHFWGDYVNMIASRKSDQRPLINLTIKNLTLSICKDYQGAIHNFENVRESLRINYFAIIIILLHVYLSSYNKLDWKDNSTHFASHNPITHSMRKNYKMSGKFAYWSNYLRTFNCFLTFCNTDVSDDRIPHYLHPCFHPLNICQ